MKVVFVHIGANSTPTLFNVAEVARQSLPRAEICLISDQKNLLRDFPGSIFQYDPTVVEPFISSFLKRNRELENVAGGYWINTIRRLFALIQVARLNPDETIIHLESDVYLYADEDDLNKYEFERDLVSYPRLSPTRGIASILYSPDLKTLAKFLQDLKTMLSQDSKIENDMDLLGCALNMDLAKELPSVPGKDEIPTKTKFIFDGAAIGQYLLGVDPVHTSGSVISGFQNSDYPIELSSLNWSISSDNKINIGYKDRNYKLLSIHAHSKELLGPPDAHDARWKEIMSEANLEVP